MYAHILLVTLCFASTIEASTWYERYKEFYTEIIPNNSTLMELWQEHVKQHQSRKRASYNIPAFTCPIPNVVNSARTVHELTPSDISVVGAIGDSLTAGNGVDALTILGDFTEYRGSSWSIGGDGYLESRLTLPNILKKYNPRLYGYSSGTGDVNSSGAKFNVAVPGNVASDMPDQARELVDRINRNPYVNTAEDWKLVTLFVGGNDMCDYCNDRVRYSPSNYAMHIGNALDILMNGLTRTMVNVVLIFDIAPIAAMEGGFFCSLAHTFVCGCAKDKSNAQELFQLTREYQFETMMMVNSGKYNTRDDFAVVVQPFFADTVPPKTPGGDQIDLSYFSPDCFHFNAKGHAAAALSLWNNMVEREDQKRTDWHLNEPFYCPGMQQLGTGNGPFFATYKNSI